MELSSESCADVFTTSINVITEVAQVLSGNVHFDLFPGERVR